MASTAKAEAAMSLTIDGKLYDLIIADLTSLDTMALRRATGMGIRGLMKAAEEDPDIDVIAALVWLSRRTHGERGLRFEEVAAEIGYDVDIQMDGAEAGGDKEDGSDPEA